MMTFNVLEYCRALEAAARLLLDARGVRRRPPVRGVRRGRRRTSRSRRARTRRRRSASEAFIYSYAKCYGLRYLVFRFSNVYGRFDNDLQRMERVLPLFIHQLSRGEPITVYGGDEKVLDFTFIDDCIDGIARGIERLAAGRVENETINLAYGQGNTLVRAAELIAAELGVTPEITQGAVARRRGDALRRRHPQGARAPRLAARDAARRRHPARGRLVPRVAGGAPGRGHAHRPRERSPATSSTPSSPPLPERVVALFGPTASRQDRCRAGARRAAGRRGRLGRLGRPLRGHPGDHGGAAISRAPRRRRPARPRGLGRRVPARSRTPRSTRSSPAADADRRGRDRPVPARRPCRRSGCRRRLRPARASGGARSTTSSARRGRTTLLAERDPAAAARVHPNDRRRVVRALELAEAGASLAPGRGPPLERRLPPADAPRRPRPRSRRARRADRGAGRGDGRARRRRGGAARVGGAAFGDGAQGARSRGARDAPARRGRGGGRRGNAEARPLPAQVAAAPAGRRYSRCRPSTRGDRR